MCQQSSGWLGEALCHSPWENMTLLTFCSIAHPVSETGEAGQHTPVEPLDCDCTGSQHRGPRGNHLPIWDPAGLSGKQDIGLEEWGSHLVLVLDLE